MTQGIPISRKLVFVNSLSGVIARIINVGLLFWLHRYLISRIPTDEYALYPVFVSMSMFLLLLKTLLSTGLVRYITEAKAQNDAERMERIVSTIFFVSAIVSVGTLFGGSFFALNIEKIITVETRYTTEATIMATVIIASFAFRVLLSPFDIGLIVDQRFVLFNMIEVCTVIVRIILLLVLLLGVSTRVIWVPIATECAQIVGISARSLLSRRLLPELRFKRNLIDGSIAKELLSFGGWSFIGQIANRIRMQADPIILNKLATSFDVTCFYLGNVMLEQINALVIKVSQTVLPGLTAMHATDQNERIGNAFIRYGRLMIWAFMLVALPLIIYRKQLFTLYVGERFLQAATVLLLLMASEGAIKGLSMLNALAVARGQVKFLAVSNLALQIGNFILTIVLVTRYSMGAVGSAVSTAVFLTGVMPLLFVPHALRLSGTSFTRWIKESILPGYVPTLITAVVFIPIREMAPPETWAAFFIQGLSAMAIYLAALYFLAFHPEDKSDFKRFVLHFGSSIKNIR
jgi:O-antigen/teichoic acid export membrane protein